MLLMVVVVHADVAQRHLAALAVELHQLCVLCACVEALTLEAHQVVAGHQLAQRTRAVVTCRLQLAVLLLTVGAQELAARVARRLRAATKA